MRTIGKGKNGGTAKSAKLQFKSGYRIHLCRLDALLAFVGKPLTLIATFKFDRPMTELETDMQLLVDGGTAHRGSRIEVANTAAPKGMM